VTEPLSLHDTLDLLDYRRKVADLYASVRAATPGEATWLDWREQRDALFATHPQSAIPEEQRATFERLPYFDYDPTWRVTAALEPTDGDPLEISHSAEGTTTARLFALAHFTRHGTEHSLPLYWLDEYSGGLFLPFRDTTSGAETYGGGRYLLDSAKGADLGGPVVGQLPLDFNYAYHPSCAHNPAVSCPLAPRDNWLDVPIRAGERLA
jgi:uncharacterized protein